MPTYASCHIIGPSAFVLASWCRASSHAMTNCKKTQYPEGVKVLGIDYNHPISGASLSSLVRSRGPHFYPGRTPSELVYTTVCLTFRSRTYTPSAPQVPASACCRVSDCRARLALIGGGRSSIDLSCVIPRALKSALLSVGRFFRLWLGTPWDSGVSTT